MHKIPKRKVYLPEKFSCSTRENVRLCLTTEADYGKYSYITLVDGIENDIETIGKSEHRINPKEKFMCIDYMQSDPSARGVGIGTCLHLTTIMEMLENNIEIMELAASPHAIPFHVRLGFKPSSSWDEEYLVKNMISISEQNDPMLSSFRNDAKYIINSGYSDKLKAKLANNLLLEYINQAMQFKSVEELKLLVPKGVIMTLKRCEVIENKDFYNQLFKKYKIDYQIEG